MTTPRRSNLSRRNHLVAGGRNEEEDDEHGDEGSSCFLRWTNHDANNNEKRKSDHAHQKGGTIQTKTRRMERHSVHANVQKSTKRLDGVCIPAAAPAAAATKVDGNATANNKSGRSRSAQPADRSYYRHDVVATSTKPSSMETAVQRETTRARSAQPAERSYYRHDVVAASRKPQPSSVRVKSKVACETRRPRSAQPAERSYYRHDVVAASKKPQPSSVRVEQAARDIRRPRSAQPAERSQYRHDVGVKRPQPSSNHHRVCGGFETSTKSSSITRGKSSGVGKENVDRNAVLASDSQERRVPIAKVEDCPTTRTATEANQHFEDRINQLRLKLDVFRRQNRRQTKEIARLRKQNAKLQSDLKDAHVAATAILNAESNHASHHQISMLSSITENETKFPVTPGMSSSERRRLQESGVDESPRSGEGKHRHGSIKWASTLLLGCGRNVQSPSIA